MNNRAPGVDVMITIFAKTSSSLSKKRQFFSQNFSAKIFKNHNIGSWSFAATNGTLESF
jgi:hypothetical protein